MGTFPSIPLVDGVTLASLRLGVRLWSMQLRPFGNTGLLVSPIGLGMAALGRPGYIKGDTVSRLLTLGEEAARYWAIRSQLPWN